MKNKLFLKSYMGFFISLNAISAINQDEFHLINQVIVNTYRDVIFNKTNNIIILNELWNNFGQAFGVDSVRKLLNENKLILTLTGKVAQFEGMHEDGYAIVVCHEIGHLLGGAPKQRHKLDNWSSVEGQADYYATNQCMWEYILASPANEFKSSNFESSILCQKKFKKDDDKYQGCIRIASGIIALRNYFNATSSKEAPVSIFKNETKKAKKILEKFPSDQCRIDTLIAGLLNKERPACWLAS